MDVLRCKSSDMVREGIAAQLLTYNLVRTIMRPAACLAHRLRRRSELRRELCVQATQQGAKTFGAAAPARRPGSKPCLDLGVQTLQRVGRVNS